MYLSKRESFLPIGSMVDDESILESEVAEGEALLLETIQKGRYFEVGDPTAYAMNECIWQHNPRPPKPKKPKAQEPTKPLDPARFIPPSDVHGLGTRARELHDQALSCAFCGGKHVPTSTDTVQCMGIYWALYYQNHGKPPLQSEVYQRLHPAPG